MATGLVRASGTYKEEDARRAAPAGDGARRSPVQSGPAGTPNDATCVVKIMTDIDITLLEELADYWDGIREDYQDSRNDEYDKAVSDCAARLATDPGGGSAFVWTLGLVVMAPYLTWLPGEGVVPHAMAALNAADTALRERPCAHESHPYANHDSGDDMYLAEQLTQLADDTAEWNEDRPRGEWRCPRNVAGFARIAMDIVEPGSVTDIPPRLPMEDRSTMETLTALLHGYPKPWTDIDEEISSQAWNLAGCRSREPPRTSPDRQRGHLVRGVRHGADEVGSRQPGRRGGKDAAALRRRGLRT